MEFIFTRFIKEEMKYDLFDLLKSIEEKNQEINNIFGGDGYLDKEISILWAIIEYNMNIDIGNEKTGDILCDFACGDITKKQAISKLKKLSKMNDFLS